eukprot:GHVS01081476.1.p1 GENE.GHVS01081476.1~~GHVS01081476.1.p1  ORF type:complete len:616 (-),score=106.74 GHVS01081476.1:369-2216(-)
MYTRCVCRLDWLSKICGQVEDLVICFGSGLTALQCVPQLEFEAEPYQTSYKFLGVFAKNRKEWAICEQTCNAYSMALVPLYDTLGVEACRYILEQTGMRCVVASADCADKLLDMLVGVEGGGAAAGLLSHIVVMETAEGSAAAVLHGKAEKLKIEILLWKDVIEKGNMNRLPITPATASSVNTICYTSGTTGMPKGVVLSNKNIVTTVVGALLGPFSIPELTVTPEDIHLSYLPLAHVFERIVDNVLFACGAKIGYFGGDAHKLMDDLSELRPTVFVSVPRLFNRINDKVAEGVRDKSYLSQALFSTALRSKINRIKKSGDRAHPLWDILVFAKTKALLGGRVRYMISGSAPLDPIVQDKIQSLFCVPLLEGYGLTETVGGTFVCSPADCESGHVGGVLPSVEFRVESVPDMGYDATGKEPSGELCLRGHSVFPGYFRNKEETNATLDSEGWLHTGDVAAILANGAVKLVDRKKNLFKLSQGEYVSPERIENVYLQASLVAQIFVCGYSQQSFVVAVVVPDVAQANKWLQKQHPNETAKSMEELCQMSSLKAAILDEMKTTSTASGLKGFECAKKIHLHPELFSMENELITPTFKLKRHTAKKMFKDVVDAMYEE